MAQANLDASHKSGRARIHVMKNYTAMCIFYLH